MLIHTLPAAGNSHTAAAGERRDMFLNRNRFKRMMANAYKGGGLRVKNDGEGISISTVQWSAYFLKGEMPKETLGDLIALVGELPDREEVYLADKNGNQMEIYYENSANALKVATMSEKELYETPVIIAQFPYFLGLLQNPANAEITVVNKKLLDVIDKSFVDSESGEELPTGPVSGGGMVEGTLIPAASWYNNAMAYSIGFLNLDNDETTRLIKEFEGIKLW